LVFGPPPSTTDVSTMDVTIDDEPNPMEEELPHHPIPTEGSQGGNTSGRTGDCDDSDDKSREISRLQSHFETTAGIRPSRHWLRECLIHFRHHPGNHNTTGAIEELIWNQILHADLRDVVRRCPDGDTERMQLEIDTEQTHANDVESTAARQLREAIAKFKRPNISNNSSCLNEIENQNQIDENPQENSTHGNRSTKNYYQSQHKVTLPSNFRLLVQMEEVIDATLNLEQQLSSMGGTTNAGSGNGNQTYGDPHGGNARNSNNRSDNATNNNYNQNGMRNSRYRCFKIALSDGYYSNGKSIPPSNDENDHEDENAVFVAMETSPLHNLSYSSPPGLKILIHGTSRSNSCIDSNGSSSGNDSLVVRFGILQLNDGNSTIIGGHVPHWQGLWKKAKEKIQREKGHGVDPTIKALIWNPLTGDEEEVDEGENESGDVTAQAAPERPHIVPSQPIIMQQPQQQMQQQQNQIQQPPPQQQPLQPPGPGQTPPPTITPNASTNTSRNNSDSDYNQNRSSVGNMNRNPYSINNSQNETNNTRVFGSNAKIGMSRLSIGGTGRGSGGGSATRQTTMDDFPRTRQKPSYSYPSSSSPEVANANTSLGHGNSSNGVASFSTTHGNSAARSVVRPSNNPYQRNTTNMNNSVINGDSVTTNEHNISRNINSNLNTNNSMVSTIGDSPSAAPYPNSTQIQGSQNQYRSQQSTQRNPSTERNYAPNPYASLRPSDTSRSTSNPNGTDSSNTANPYSRNSLHSTGNTAIISNSTPKKYASSSQESSAALSSNPVTTTALGNRSDIDILENSSDSIHLSFREMQELLEKIKREKTLYSRYVGNTFVVPCKMSSGDDKQFNIVKADKKKRKMQKSEKKYEFLLVSPFIGSFAADGSIACRVESALMESYFPHAPVRIAGFLSPSLQSIIATSHSTVLLIALF